MLCIFSILYADYTNINVSYYVWPMYKTPIVICSIFVFLFFKNLKINTNNLINLVAKTTFGIYLIHMNPYFWKVFWQYLYRNYIFFYQEYYIIFAICECLTVFIICGFIEFVRIKLMDKELSIYLDRIIGKLSRNKKNVQEEI